MDLSAGMIEKAAAIQPLQKEAFNGQHSKGSHVQLPDGRRGKVAYADSNIARVKTDDGKNVSMKHHQLAPLTVVKEHTRLAPARKGR